MLTDLSANLFYYFNHPGGPWGSNSNFVKSKNVANKSCQVCFRDDKNAFGITPWPLGAGGAIGGPWGCQNQISSNQKVSLTKVVRYVSRVTKIHSGSPSDPWGHPGGGAWGCQNQISSSQKVSVTKVVRYVSGVTKNHSGSPSDPWGSRRTWGGPWGVKKFHQIKKFR